MPHPSPSSLRTVSRLAGAGVAAVAVAALASCQPVPPVPPSPPTRRHRGDREPGVHIESRDSQGRDMTISIDKDGVRIYIESNRYERNLWEALGEQIRVKWDTVCQQLAPGRMPALQLRARGLPVDQIDSFPSLDDADGVVLLWGRKTSDALVAQINKVENKMSLGRDAAPGIVAYLMPPQQQATEPVPAWGWQVLRFNSPSEDSIDVMSEENDQLERFLKKVYLRRQQRDQQDAGVSS